jgi:hypothetical protein
VRLAYVYFDTQEATPLDLALGGGNSRRQTSNSYWGLGPYAGLELERRLEGTGLALTGRLEVATLLGRIRQGFFEDAPGAEGPPLHAETRDSGSQDTPVLSTELGLSWCPPASPGLRLFAGYAFEQWWHVGRLSRAGTTGELTDQGLVIQAMVNF